MGAMTTLSVLMIQGGVHDLVYEYPPSGSAGAVVTFVMTVSGGGLLAGCLALIMNRIR